MDNSKLSSAKLFDLQGCSAGTSPTKGIDIQDGKKVIIK